MAFRAQIGGRCDSIGRKAGDGGVVRVFVIGFVMGEGKDGRHTSNSCPARDG